MATSRDMVESEALMLSRGDRSRLIVHLLESIEKRPAADPLRVEHAWLAEANRRYQAYLRGKEQAIPAEDVFSELRDDDH